jgi:hypothetical protein
MHIGGPVRYRMGGYAMLPRSSIRRLIQVGPTDCTHCSDTPFCGQTYFKPCATIDYAMSLMESYGPWIEFQLGDGDYVLTSPIVINFAGITLRGSSSISKDGTTPSTQFHCGLRACLIINSPSFRLIHVHIDTRGMTPRARHARTRLDDGVGQGSSNTNIMINSIDVVFINCSVSQSFMQLSPGADTTILDSYMTGSPGQSSPTIVATSSTLTIFNTVFADHRGSNVASAIWCTDTNLVIHQATFSRCQATEGVRSHTYLEIYVGICSCVNLFETFFFW